ncbi:MAG TPA: transcription antitermination factor NusB [Chthoniobacterales bacterium]
MSQRRSQPRNARELALQCLLDWEAGGDHYADDIFARKSKLAALSHHDRGFARELFYGTIRNLSAIDFILGTFLTRQTSPHALTALHLGIYQLFIINTAEHAAINESVNLAPEYARGFVNAVLRKALSERPMVREKLAAQPPGIRLSHPPGLIKRWEAAFGAENAIAIAEWDNTPADVFLRVNTLRSTPERLLAVTPRLKAVTSHPLILKCEGPLPGSEAAGCFYIQDPGTLAAPELLAPKPGERILDACAAPGGKTSYMAAIMQNQGKIVATDSSSRRIESLQQNLDALGVTIATVREHDWERGPGEFVGQLFDAILADVPCSNTGVMRRRIDVRWRLRPNIFAENARKQISIVQGLLPLLQEGGRLVYSTCSLEVEENEKVVEYILANHPELKLTGEVRRLPHVDACDGAYAARLERQ